MKKSNNEKGYALLIVLFMIVFILSISAIFMRGSISNAMQEHRVDESHLTVMTAEAGVDYTKQLLINEYFERKEELDRLVTTRIADTKKNEQVNYAAIHKEVRDRLDGYLKTRIGQEKYIADYVEFTKPYNYKLLTYSFSGSVNPREIIFSGTIEGKREETGSKPLTKRITFKQSFLIPDYSNTQPGESGLVGPLHKVYPGNITAPNCISGNNGKLNNLKCKGTKSGGYKNIEYSTVYLADGFLSDPGNLKVNKSTIFSNGTFKVQNMNAIEQSTLNIYGDLVLKNNVKVEDKSMILVIGTANLNGNVTINGKSLMCVTNSISGVNKLTIGQDSKVVYRDSLTTKLGVSGAGELIKVNSDSEFWDKCKLGNSTPSNWSKPKLIDVNYE